MNFKLNVQEKQEQAHLENIKSLHRDLMEKNTQIGSLNGQLIGINAQLQVHTKEKESWQMDREMYTLTAINLNKRIQELENGLAQRQAMAFAVQAPLGAAPPPGPAPMMARPSFIPIPAPKGALPPTTSPPLNAPVRAVRASTSIPKIGRAVQQECRDRSRMPSSA
eukprot:TRINITY_DN3855_c0_g1_i16.p1 TRINITY_DN3855_c0_g1~~TRINITY_DN3855_c0_g1_i16.p1  ORF type:complete len:166 (+),score=28.39 TRINITY_DN3855_c0_g1_i16:350-847(+)